VAGYGGRGRAVAARRSRLRMGLDPDLAEEGRVR
jgi:hypothetical protein